MEEETEAEWEKTTAKSTRQESEYQTETTAMSAMEASLAPIDFGPGAGPEGKIRVRLLKDTIFHVISKPSIQAFQRSIGCIQRLCSGFLGYDLGFNDFD